MVPSYTHNNIMKNTLQTTLAKHPELQHAFWRLEALDANSAYLVATDILDALEDDVFDPVRMADELNELCAQIEVC